ncbi:hypothetical protein KC19_6G174100 [Ceratodon purpureus]|uniref:Uncharacterized protein n=1 Tax=Ceratodon purpureus TaxID=3225 RepID=A0A8T0HGU6_CERPU|nr:hypothetical protein KC19_6G174100 [Ceratodon purpureus]
MICIVCFCGSVAKTGSIVQAHTDHCCKKVRHLAFLRQDSIQALRLLLRHPALDPKVIEQSPDCTRSVSCNNFPDSLTSRLIMCFSVEHILWDPRSTLRNIQQ